MEGEPNANGKLPLLGGLAQWGYGMGQFYLVLPLYYITLQRDYVPKINGFNTLQFM